MTNKLTKEIEEENIKFAIVLITNIIVAIFLAMVGIILTLQFQKIICSGGIIFRIVMSTLWVLGLLSVILKGYTINWSLIRL